MIKKQKIKLKQFPYKFILIKTNSNIMDLMYPYIKLSNHRY